MKKLIFTLLALAIFPLSSLLAQSVYYSEGFEASTSLPTGWFKTYQGGVPNDSLANWTVRDSGTSVPGITKLSKAYQSLRAVVVTWWMVDSTDIADAWLVTKKFGALPTDAILQFYACGGTNSPDYADSMQVLISPTGDTALSSFVYLQSYIWPAGTVFGNFQQQFIDLSSYAGSTPRIAFRYYMDCTADGYAVHIDNFEMLGTVGINQIGNNLPKKFALSQNYPNPFNPTTKIKFDVPRNGNVLLEVYNNLGQLVKTLHNGYTNAGYYETNFDGSSLTSGIYYYKITSQDFVQTKKMILVK